MTTQTPAPRFSDPGKSTPPTAPRRATQCHAHESTWSDHYAWLRDPEWEAVLRDPDNLQSEIKQYLEAENAYCKQRMEPSEDLQEMLLQEMRGRVCDDFSELPEKDGPYAYLWRYLPGAEHSRFVRTPREGGDEQLVFDADAEANAAGDDYFELGDCEVSPDHRLFAWSFDDNGAERYRLRIRNIDSGEDRQVEISDVDSVCWASSDILFYVKTDEHHRANRVFKHKLGTDPERDELVVYEPDDRFSLSVGRMRCGRAVEIVHSTDDQTEVWLVDLNDDSLTPRLIAERRPGHEYTVDMHKDLLFILTNSQSATDFRMVTAPISAPEERNWQECLAHECGKLLLEHHVFENYLVWVRREEANACLYYLSINDEQLEPLQTIEQSSACSTGFTISSGEDSDVSKLEFSDLAYAIALEPSPEFDSKVLRLIYCSPTTPDTWIDVNLDSGDQHELKKLDVPSGHNPEDYQCDRIWVKAMDGAEIPVTLLYHSRTRLDGTAPCVLFGYGAYGSSVAADFSTDQLSLVDRGAVCAVAHVRGGQELGRAWYLQSKREGKELSFSDFIACARHLGEEKIVDSNRIISCGGSAGGLLVGAALNKAPTLFKAVVAEVPFVDVLNTMLDDTLPLTPGEWEQWGNPIESRESFELIRSYSPYDQVADIVYPPMLVTASLGDPRVGYWEPAKWVARMRSVSPDSSANVLLKTNMGAGHAGQSGRYAGLGDTAHVYAFICCVSGLPLLPSVAD